MKDILYQQSKRIEGLDLIRTFAIFCVILVHCFRELFPLGNIEYFSSLPAVSKIFYFVCYAAGALGVPLFFILSGYLLLSRDYDEFNTKKFYKRNLLAILITWEIWIPISNLISTFFYDIPFHWSTLLRNMLFVEQVNLGPSWYMPVILGIYIFIPYLSRVLKTMSSKEILLTFSISYIYFFIIPTLNHLKAIQWGSVLDLHFSGGLYGIYVILGYLLHKYEDQLKSSYKWSFIVVISFISMIFYQKLAYQLKNEIFNMWYDICLLPIITISIFVLCKEMKFSRFRKLITAISKCSFGMYLTHMIFILTFSKYGFLNFIASEELRILLLTITVFVVSFVFVMLLSKLPKLGRILVRC